MKKRGPASRTCSSAKARCCACRARSSALFLREYLLEGAHGYALVDAAAIERVGGDQRLGFLARRAVHNDQRTGARPVGRVFQRAAEHDLFLMKIPKLDVICAVGVAQTRGVGTVETNDGVHGMVRGYG